MKVAKAEDCPVLGRVKIHTTEAFRKEIPGSVTCFSTKGVSEIVTLNYSDEKNFMGLKMIDLNYSPYIAMMLLGDKIGIPKDGPWFFRRNNIRYIIIENGVADEVPAFLDTTFILQDERTASRLYKIKIRE